VSKSKVPEKVRYLLWAKSAGRCEFNGCNKPLWRDGLTKIEMNFADVAHIIGDSPKGPRGDVILSKDYCNDANNLMLMCLDHHRMIDEICESYPDEVLRQMKISHEIRIEQVTAITPDKTSHVVIYRGGIGENLPKIDRHDTWQAMFPSWYPAGNLPVELGLSNSATRDDETNFWGIEEANLERQFQRNIHPLIESHTRNHFSIFAIAPQPLLVKLGSLFSDIYPAEVYQLHREPPTWEWQLGPDQFEYLVEESESRHKAVAVLLSLSATIDTTRVEKALSGLSYSTWEFSIKEPHVDYLKTRSQLELFRQEFRRLLNNVKARHGEDATIHIFPAVPVSVAVEIGRVWQPKADLPLVIYDQNRRRDGFIKALSIGGE